MNKLIAFITLGISFLSTTAQNTINVTPQEIEAIFLNNNKELIREKMEIDIADAQISEAKIWDNPELNIGDINFWKKNGIDEYGNPIEYSAQFSIDLTQRIPISARRSKLINAEKANKEVVIKEYEKVLSQLKFELKTIIDNIIFLQEYENILENYIRYSNNLIEGYDKLKENRDVAVDEYMRIESYQLSVISDVNQFNSEKRELVSRLKTMLSVSPDISIHIINNKKNNYSLFTDISISELITLSKDKNPDIISSNAYSDFYKKDMLYQKSLAIPDLNFSIKYDRYGGVWKNFYGFGVGIDIPLFNRNKSAIKITEIKTKQNDINRIDLENMIANEVTAVYENYNMYYKFYNSINNKNIISEFENISNNYKNNLFTGNISLIELIDFIDSTKETYQIILRTELEMKLLSNKIEYLTGHKIN